MNPAKSLPLKKMQPITFRVDNELLEIIRKQAENEKITLNNIINRILKRNVEWYLYEPKISLMPLPKLFLEKLFEKRSEDEIIKLASDVGKNIILDMYLFMNKKFDWILFLRWFEIRMKNSPIKIDHITFNSKKIFIMKHDLGEKWSLYHKTIFELISKENNINISEIKYNRNMISLEY